MNSPDFPSLVQCLERELAAQRGLVQILDQALAAVRSRDLDILETHLRKLDAEGRRVKVLAKDRESLILTAAPARKTASLQELARMPGAPFEILSRFRGELREAVDNVVARTRRLQVVVRELGEVYGSAIAVLVHGRSAGASAPVHQGSIVNTEA